MDQITYKVLSQVDIFDMWYLNHSNKHIAFIV